MSAGSAPLWIRPCVRPGQLVHRLRSCMSTFTLTSFDSVNVVWARDAASYERPLFSGSLSVAVCVCACELCYSCYILPLTLEWLHSISLYAYFVTNILRPHYLSPLCLSAVLQTPIILLRSSVKLIPRLHDEAGSKSWLYERSTSARRASSSSQLHRVNGWVHGAWVH